MSSDPSSRVVPSRSSGSHSRHASSLQPIATQRDHRSPSPSASPVEIPTSKPQIRSSHSAAQGHADTATTVSSSGSSQVGVSDSWPIHVHATSRGSSSLSAAPSVRKSVKHSSSSSSSSSARSADRGASPSSLASPRKALLVVSRHRLLILLLAACLLASLFTYAVYVFPSAQPCGPSWGSQFRSTFAGGSLGDGSQQLTVLMPFITADVPHIKAGITNWAELGPACRRVDVPRTSLRFFHSRNREYYDAEGGPDLAAWMRSQPAVVSNVLPCFRDVDLIFANLTNAEDGYPEGPSNMFFKLILELAAPLLPQFTHIYWMEWDVQPIRAMWIDKLYELAGDMEFWVLGARYRGRAFDEVVKDASSWSWVGHINGNALYKLHDADFNQFLRLTVEREPPSHYWKPFDVAMWRTLYNFPYSWHLYQVHGDRFRTTSAVVHLGFTMHGNEIDSMKDTKPGVFMVHGDRGSAGKSKYERKFKKGVAQTNATVLWRDEITPAMRVSVLLRTFRADLPFAALAIKSAQRYMPGALEYVVVVPENDLFDAKKWIPSGPNVRIRPEKRVLHSDHIQQKLTKLTADHWCNGDYIFHLDSDVVLYRTILRRDVLLFDKPIITFDRYDNLHLTEAAAAKQQVYKWQNGTSFAVGQRVEFEFSRSNDNMYPRAAYAAARSHIERTHKMLFSAFLDTREGKVLYHKNLVTGESHAITPFHKLFSDFNYMGAFLYYQAPHMMAWTYLGEDQPPPHAMPFAYNTIRPPLTCQGNARLYRGPLYKAEFAAQLAIIKRLALGQLTSCNELHAYIISHGFEE